ncbi:probable cytochrome P450 6a21 isoform X1 [Stomoxys calcitrans]|uniref:probable cytochrome P450 6a21 isoform X1 n=1 Tax=Stomoxys calcitrans TaxID=35570 RepID=UPI0027E2DBDB|nr:probable cytochrome P450 6a21 isoform X1 [Stomoxys calcitrans]
MSVISILLAILAGLLVYIGLRVRKHFNYWKDLGVPCDQPNWLMGSVAGFLTSKPFNQIVGDYYEKYRLTGPYAGFYWFYKLAVFVMEPNLIKHILIKDFSKFTDRGLYTNEEDDPLTGQLFNLDGAKWRNMRNKLSPTFTSGKMKVMFPLVTKLGDDLVDVFHKSLPSDQVLEVRDLVARFTTDVIGTCAFGIEIGSLHNPNVEFRHMSGKAFKEQRYGTLGFVLRFSFPELSSRLHIKETLADVEEFFLGIVRNTVDYREKNNVKRNDFMDMLIDMKNNKLMKSETGEEMTNLTFGQIAAQAFIFLLAGFETSSTTMSFALYELAQNQEVQQRAREEVQQVLEKHGGQFTYECMKELVYLDQVIEETLRLYTIVSALLRKTLEDYVVPGHPEYVIKKGMIVIIPAGPIHRDERYFPQPNVFNPDNFSPEKVAARDSILNLSFGEGPRNCIGMRFGKMQTVVGLAVLLKNFKFSTCERTPIPMKYDKKSFLVSSESGIYLKVEKL